jgi:DNA-binding transcriptional ArsR family regulator
MANNPDDSFNTSKAEVFEALGHPTRIRLLQCLAEKPLAFSELKRAAGIEGNGLLSFHLGKLGGLVKLNPEGAYALTDEGREALRIVEASKSQGQEGSLQRPSIRMPRLNTILVGLVVVLIILAAASAIEYNQIQGLDSRIQTTTSTITGTTSTVLSTIVQTTTLTQAVTSTATSISTSISTSTATSTTTSTATSTYYPFVAPQMQVELNATTMRTGGALAVTITLTNVLPYNLSFIPSYPTNPNIPYWDQYDFICGGGGSPIWNLAAYAVFQGHYSSANLSSASRPLTLIPPLLIGCPAWVNPDKLVFLPGSDQVVAYYPTGNATAPTNEPAESAGKAAINATTLTCLKVPAGYISCGGSTSLFGYWSQPTGPGLEPQDANTTSSYFNYFPPGQYTIVVEDLWGAASFSYLQVASA